MTSIAVVAQAPQQLTLYPGFGGTVAAVELPQPPSPAPCTADKLVVKEPEHLLFASPAAKDPNPTANALCVGVSKAGLFVHVLVQYEFALGQAVSPITFDYPSHVSCVPLRAPDGLAKLMLRLRITVGKKLVVECDISRSFLYALAVERQGQPAEPVVPVAGAMSWPVTIDIPWADLELRRALQTVMVEAYAGNGAKPFATNSTKIAIADRSGALTGDYAPLRDAPASAQSSKKPPLRLHSIGADAAYDPTQTTLAAAAFAQNDAANITQRSISQIIAGAPLPLPTAGFGPSAAETLATRTQPLLAWLKPSKALGDQDLQLMVDTVPFSFTKVGSLAAGYTAGYSDRIVSAVGFSGLQGPGLWNQAYALTVSIPTPPPKPTPSPSPSPHSLFPVTEAPPPFARPGAIEESKALHDPLVAIALIDNVTGNSGYIDSVSGAALGANLYRNTCSTDTSYCALTLHLYGNVQNDTHPRVTSPAIATPPYATTFRFAGESGSYTRASAPDAPPYFFQVAETIGVQQSDRFFAPSAGAVTAYTPLDGAIGRVVISYGAAANQHVVSADLLGIRMTNAYGDVFTDTAWQLVMPVDFFGGRRPWTLHAGGQSETLSDRIAELQQGLATSYYATIFPATASLTKPVAPAIIRPQSQYDLTLSSPPIKLTSSFSYTLTAGYQTGFVTNCAPAPVVIVCATGHDHATTFAFFGTQKPLGFGIATTASASIPGDLAVGSTSRYFGTYVNAPGSLTSYVTFSKFCLLGSGAYSNAAYPTGVPLAQQGSTISAKLGYTIGELGLETSYFKIVDRQDPTFNQAGFYALLRFTTGFGKPKPPKNCSS